MLLMFFFICDMIFFIGFIDVWYIMWCDVSSGKILLVLIDFSFVLGL